MASLVLATAVFLLFIYTITYFARTAQAPSPALYLALGTAVVFLANIIWPHLGATLALGSKAAADKLDKGHEYLVTVRGAGYRLLTDTETPGGGE